MLSELGPYFFGMCQAKHVSPISNWSFACVLFLAAGACSWHRPEVLRNYHFWKSSHFIADWQELVDKYSSPFSPHYSSWGCGLPCFPRSLVGLSSSCLQWRLTAMNVLLAYCPSLWPIPCSPTILPGSTSQICNLLVHLCPRVHFEGAPSKLSSDNWAS